MKIILFLPNTTSHKNDSIWVKKKRRMGYAPTSLTLLSALVPKQLNAEVRVIDEAVESVDIDDWSADLVGISVLTANAPYAYALSKKLRKRGITVVLGGVHTTLMPEEAIQNADAIVIGYAEKSWPQLLLDFSNGRLKKVYRPEGWKEVFQGRAMPAPDRSKLHWNQYILPNRIEATRGCYNKCSFCVIPGFNQAHFSKRPIDAIIKEIKQMPSKRVAFLDSSPTEDIEYSKALMKAMIPLKIKWYSCATTKIINDDEWFELARKSGCRGVLTGFESINQQAINDTRKRFNKVERYGELVRKLHDAKISILGTFILGFDHDDHDVFDATLEFVNSVKIDILHFAIATPFPGTPFYNKLLNENRILHQEWEKYDGHHVVFQPNKLSPEELRNGFFELHRRAHSYRSIYKRLSGAYHSLGFRLIANWGFRLYGKYQMNHIA